MEEKISNKTSSEKINWVQVDSMEDYSKAPYFIEKNKKATEFLLKHGLPKDVEKKVKR